MPVMNHGQMVGVATEGHWRPATHYEKRWASYTSYEEIQTDVREGKTYKAVFRNDGSSPRTWNDFWPIPPINGVPGVTGSVNGTAFTARQFDDLNPTALYHGGNKSPATKHMLSVDMAFLNTFATVPLPLIAYDRVLAYDNCTVTTATQLMDNTLPAQRYIAPGQAGLCVFVTLGTTWLGNTANEFTSINYVNQLGNPATMPTTQPLAMFPDAFRDGQIVAPILASNNYSLTPFMPLAAGDSGVRSITDYTCSVDNTGTVSFVLAKPLAWVMHDGPAAQMGNNCHSVSFVDTCMVLSRIYDGACLSFIFAADTNTNGNTQQRMDWNFGWA